MAEALPLSSSGVLRTELGLPVRPLGSNSAEEDSDSLDTSDEYALAGPGKPRCERPYEDGIDLVDNGVTQALALMPWALGHLGLDGQAIHIWPPC